MIILKGVERLDGEKTIKYRDLVFEKGKTYGIFGKNIDDVEYYINMIGGIEIPNKGDIYVDFSDKDYNDGSYEDDSKVYVVPNNGDCNNGNCNDDITNTDIGEVGTNDSNEARSNKESYNENDIEEATENEEMINIVEELQGDAEFFRWYRDKVSVINGTPKLLERFSIRDNLNIISDMSDTVGDKTVANSLYMVGLDNPKLKVSKLSIDDKFRVKLAQILCLKPDIICCVNVRKYMEEDIAKDIESLIVDTARYMGITLLYGDVNITDNFDEIYNVSELTKRG